MVNSRLIAFGLAFIASSALVSAILAGTHCEFLEINAKTGNTLITVDGVELAEETAYLGVYCSANDALFDIGSDKMWETSRIFFIVSLVVGSIATALTWIVSLCVPPTFKIWKAISIMCAFSAVFGVPVFLLFEAEPCSELSFQQECKFSTGSYLQIVSVVAWIAAVIVTQCLDPPEWGEGKTPWETENGDQEFNDQEDPEYGAALRITGYTPAKETRKSKNNSWTSFSSRFKKTDDLEIENVKTKSTRDEEEEEDQAVDTSRNGAPKFAKFDDDIDALVNLADERQRRESPTKSKHVNASPETRDRVTVITDTSGENGIETTSYPAYPSYPAYQDEPLQQRSPYKARSEARSPQPEKAASPAKSFNNMQSPETAKSPAQTHFPAFSKGDHIALLEQSSATQEESNPLIEAERKKKKSIRNLTMQFKQDVKRRTSRRKQRFGYNQMLDDEISDDGFPYQSPPIQIKIDLNENKNDDLFLKDDDMRFETKQEEQLMDDWNALHAATNAGFQIGMQEGTGAFDNFEDEPNHKFEFDMNSYHSDPEPVLYSSEEEDDIIQRGPRSLDRPVPNNIGHHDDDDNSTLSSHSSASARLRESTKRGRSLLKRTLRRRRRARSPLGSLASGSLMGTTIDEETVQDIIEESSAGEEELDTAYSLERTLSAPEPATSGLGKLLARRGRRHLSQQAASVRSARPSDMAKPSWLQSSSLDNENAVASDNILSAQRSSIDGNLIARIDNMMNQVENSIRPNPNPPLASPARGTVIRSHSMTLERDTSKQQTIHCSSQSVSQIKSRRLRNQIHRDDDNSSKSSNSGRSRVNKARELRRQRLLNQSMSSGDQSGVNASYLSKISNKSGTPGRDYSFNVGDDDDDKTQVIAHNEIAFKEEKKDEEDTPFDYVKVPQVVTPDSSTGEPFFKEEKKEDISVTEVTAPAPTPHGNMNSAFNDDYLNFDQGAMPSVRDTNTTFDTVDSLKVVTAFNVPSTGSVFNDDNISVVTPHLDMKDSMDEEDDMHINYVKAGAANVREKIMAGFSIRDDQASASLASTDNSEKYGNSLMDELDLQLIEVRRGDREYGDEEASL